ncbi:hemicentin-2-like [Actinia tenebrosa]|uniref:Hemicentin-2-like n=1 Tax=Actinia tenebrosa TaxID=6105 RepID=A0A6P8IN86_ACTTE|nr:hemicentin-2-like [Actinia tenebrosa]
MVSWWSLWAMLLISGMLSLSDADVLIPLSDDLLVQGKSTTVSCTVSNGEKFVAWEFANSRITMDKAASVHVEKISDTQYNLVISNAKVSNGGVYTCRGDLGGNKPFTLKIEFSSNNVELKQFLRIGTNDKIVIGVYGYPNPEFEWKKDNQPFNPNTGRYRAQSDGTVLVSNVEVADKGNFSLKISQDNKRRSKELKIEVITFEPPVMIQVPLPASRYLTVGFNTTFHCRASGYPPPSYQWLNPILKPVDTFNPRFTIDGEYLYITDVKINDKGRWTCIATNVQKFTVNASAEIKDVFVRPTLQAKYLYDVVVEQGERATLDCVADGTPLPRVRWLRDGRYVMRQQLYSRRSVIRFNQATMQDMGKYVCETTNGARDQNGNVIVAQETIGLYIESAPKMNVKGTPLTVYSYLGNPKPVFIRCNFEGYPFPNVTIWFDNIQIANGTEVAIFDIITNELEDFGEYYCWSWNVHGSKNVTVSLTHAKPPTRPTNVVANATCDSVMLTWDEPKDDGGMVIVHYVLNFGNQRWNTEDTYPQYFIEELKPATSYTIQIQARNVMGVGDYETVTVTTKEYCAPGHPILWHPRQKMIEDTAFFLRWHEPQKNGGDPNVRYQVVVSEDLEDGPFPIKKEETGVTEFYVDNLKFGMHYEIDVYAYNQGGWSVPATGLYHVPAKEVLTMQLSSSCGLSISFTLVTLLLSITFLW